MPESETDARRELDARLAVEVELLAGDDLAWWRAHRVEPFVIERFGATHLAVATGEGFTLVYFHGFASFGEFSPEPWNDGLRIYDDLAHAVRSLAAREATSRLLAETAARLVVLGAYERGGPETKDRILRFLAAIGPDAAVAVPMLAAILDDRTGQDQESAVATLAAIGPAAAPAVPRLIAMAKDDEANARAFCLHAFAAIGPPAAAAVPLLLDVLNRRVAHDPDPFYVSLAADALGAVGAIEAVPDLVRLLDETDDPVAAESALAALGKLGRAAAEALPVIREWAEGRRSVGLGGHGADPRDAAVEALRILQRPGTPPGGARPL
ncbi:HEAT repeat domain-containing protein [Paludisphaera mucosa]|uniref:HEAT repeat domain-containing protein n=1 Tax=Paludisphaera mucosa TaxID=3030827 RepID=A0ABT6FK16_9BACT|nr:HEAT repeat domain-containing protein [Paludisphaera mucosa]MDG3007923.1 HEAT repeat domain-containing protein [Paludisphaera mucosa]